MIVSTGGANLAFDAAALVAEQQLQQALAAAQQYQSGYGCVNMQQSPANSAATPLQAAMNAAYVAFYQALIQAGLANGVDVAGYQTAVNAVGRGA